MFCLASWHITLCNVKICKHFLGKLIPNIKLTLLCLTFFWNNRLLSSGMLWQAQTWLFSPTLWGCYKLCQSHFSSDLLAGSQLLLSHGLQANKCPDQKKKKLCTTLGHCNEFYISPKSWPLMWLEALWFLQPQYFLCIYIDTQVFLNENDGLPQATIS